MRVCDLIVLDPYCDLLQSSELQFGFKSKRTTTMCTMILKETLSYYVNNNSLVACVFLDTTKAFDRINCCKLFNLLIQRNIPPFVIHVLLNLYTYQNVRFMWNDYVWLLLCL